MKYLSRRDRGFTFIELLVVLAIISVLAAGYLNVQHKMVDWKNTIDVSSRIKVLQQLFMVYYQDRLNALRNSASVPSGELGLVPTCASHFSASSIAGGNLYVCASNHSSGAKNTGVDYASAKNGAEDILQALSSVGAGANLLNPYDPWKRPLVFVVFSPTAQNGSYCPTVDNNSAKIAIISMGPNGILDTPNGVSATDHLASIIDSATGRFNGTWKAEGDDLVYSVSMTSIDSKKKGETQSQLSEIASLLKNSFFKYFYQVVTSQKSVPDPTKVNFFSSLFCSNPGATTGACSIVRTKPSSDILTGIYGFTTTDAKDQFGNYLCLDSDINKNLSAENCKMYSEDGENVGCFSSETSITGAVARVYSVCALDKTDRVDCHSIPGDIWSSTSSPTLLDSSYLLSVAGMY